MSLSPRHDYWSAVVAQFHHSGLEFQSPTRGGVPKGYAAHSWTSELAVVSDNTQRDVLGSVISWVRTSCLPFMGSGQTVRTVILRITCYFPLTSTQI